MMHSNEKRVSLGKRYVCLTALVSALCFFGCDDSSSNDEAGKACGNVADGAVTCNADGTQLVKCNDGTLENVTGDGACTSDQVCLIGTDGKAACSEKTSDKKNCGNVADGAVTCNADGTQLAKCSDGTLEEVTGEGACTSNQVCSIGTDGKAACSDKGETKAPCGDVADGVVTCNADGTQLAKCNDGTLEDVTGEGACTSEQACGIADGKAACYAKGTRPCGNVANGEQTCHVNNIAVCNDGTLVDIEGDAQCVDRVTHCVLEGTAPKCVDFNACGDIAHNSYGCDGDKMILCYDGEKVEPAESFQCQGDEVCRVTEIAGYPVAKCVDPNACGELANGGKKCNDAGTQILVCKSGTLEEVSGDDACSADQICIVEDDQPKCIAKAADADYVTIRALHDDWDQYVKGDCATNAPDTVERSVKISGVITAVATTGGLIYIQDPLITDGKHAGVQVYCDNKNNSCSDSFSTFKQDFNVGDRVEVIADGIGVNNCQLRVQMMTNKIVVNTLEKGGKALEPITLTADKIPQDQLHNDYNGTLVAVKDLTIQSKPATPKNSRLAVDAQENVVAILSRLMMIKTSSIPVGNKYNIEGIVANFGEVSGIMTRSDDDFEEIK